MSVGDLHPMIALPYGDHSDGIQRTPPLGYRGRHRVCKCADVAGDHHATACSEELMV